MSETKSVIVDGVLFGTNMLCAINATDIEGYLNLAVAIISIATILVKSAVFIVKKVKQHIKEKHGKDCSCGEEIKSYIKGELDE